MEYVDQTWYECTFDKVKSLTKNKGNFILYDIGAGNSVLEKKIQSIGGKWIGFDYKPRKEGIIELNLEQPVSSEIASGSPDVILLLEVIEHLFNPGMAMLNISKIAKKGTYFVMSTPNPFWSIVRLKFLLLNKFPMFEKSDMDDNHHVFTVWPHVMEKLLVDNGFEILEKYTIGYRSKFPSFNFSLLFPVKVAVHFLRRILELFSPNSKGMCYGMVAIKK